jgi:hypothetical protein
MKSTWIFAMLVVASTASALTVEKASIKKLTGDAALIVLGKVVSQESRWVDGNIFTYVTLAIDAQFKGAHRGKTVVVKNYGGTVGEISEEVAGAPVFAAGDEVLLLLIHWKGEYLIHSIALGKFAIVQEKNQRYAVNDLSNVTLVDPATKKEIAPPGEKFTKVKLETLIQQIKAFAGR